MAVRLFGEADAIATVLTAEHGATRGLARGAQSRARAATWQPGNLVQARWVARLEAQLGSLSAELVHPAAALAMDDALTLAILQSACAIADAALPEREALPDVFAGLVGVIARLAEGPAVLAALIRWEAGLLAALGYGLDLSACAVTGSAADLAYVSPRTGRAVSREGAGAWRDRLLPMPALLLVEHDSDAHQRRDGDARQRRDGDARQWRDGLRLTGHFLERDAFGSQNRALPQARVALYQRVSDLAESESRDG